MRKLRWKIDVDQTGRPEVNAAIAAFFTHRGADPAGANYWLAHINGAWREPAAVAHWRNSAGCCLRATHYPRERAPENKCMGGPSKQGATIPAEELGVVCNRASFGGADA